MLLSAAPLQEQRPLDILLVNQRVENADQWITSARPGVIALGYDPTWIDDRRLVGLLMKASFNHDHASIGHIAIVTHGEPGQVSLGVGSLWNSETLANPVDDWGALSTLLAPSARIDLYSCNVAETPAGVAVIAQLASLTGADVYASTNAVGNLDGADFVWEFTTATVADDRSLVALELLGEVAPLVLAGDFAENNDTFDRALFLGRAGSLNWNGFNIHSATDVDYFRFTIEQTGTSSHYVRALFTHSQGDIDVSLYNASQQLVRGSYGTANNETVSLENLAPGTYFIKVYGFAGAENTYNIELRGGNYTNPGDFLEPNNTRQTALPVASSGGVNLSGMNIHSNTDEDWFQFDLFTTGRTNDRVFIDNFVHANADLDIGLYNSAGTFITSSTGTTNSESISLSGRAAGRYYLRVYPFNFNSSNNYQFHLLSPPLPTNSSDFAEPNDSQATSHNLGTLTSSTTREGLSIHTANNADWYSFTTTAASTTANFVRIEFTHSAGDVDMRLVNAAGTIIASSTSTTDVEQITLNGLAAGTYFIHVYGYNGATNPNYRLIVNPPAAPAGDASEPNETRQTATNLGQITSPTTRNNLSIHTATDVDFFRFETVATGAASHRVRIEFAHSAGDVDMRLLDSAGNSLRQSTGTTDSEEISLNGLAAGTYFVQIYGYNGARNANYNLSIVPPTASTGLDPMEPNDSLAAARDLGTIRGMMPTISNLSIHMSDQDWFRFVTVGTGSAGHYAQINFQHNRGDLDFELRNSGGTVLRSSTSTTDQERISLETLPAGTYYLRIYGYSGAVNPAYELSIVAPTGTTTMSSDRLEVNNTLAQATDVRSSSTVSTLSGSATLSDLSIHTAGDLDYFRFTTVATGGSAHSVRVQSIFANGDLHLNLLDGNGTVLASSMTTNDIEVVSLNNRPAGTYYILVNGAPNTYSITFATPTATAQDDWTIMVYMTASNLFSFAHSDINEMEVAASRLPGTVNIAAFWDQSAVGTAYATGNGTQAAWTTAGRAIITPDTNMSRVATTFEILPEQNSGNPDTLRNFVQWAAAAAPARNYALVMWDHGAGLSGVNFDDADNTTFDYLTYSEVATALSAPNLPRINVLAFDACLVAQAESGYALRSVTDIFVASQELVAGNGYDYRTAFNVLESNPGNVSADTLASGIVRSFQDQYGPRNWNEDTLSAVRTSGYGALATALATFVASTANATSAQLSALKAARGSTIVYGDTDSESYNVRDLGRYMQTIANNTTLPSTIRNAATEVITALTNMTISKTADRRQSSGTSIYLPSGAPGSIYNGFSAFRTATQWDVYLTRISTARVNVTSDAATRSAGGGDWAESNNSFAVATDLGSVSGASITYTNLSLHFADDEDWFRFTTSGTGGVNDRVLIIPGNATGDQLRVDLYNGSGTTLLQSSAGGIGAQSVSLQGRSAGNYSIRVYTTAGAVVSDYSLQITAPVGNPGIDFAGDNSTQDKAYPLGAIFDNRTVSGLGFSSSAEDWFTFEGPRLSQSTAFTLRIDAPSGVPFSFQLLNALGALIGSGSGNGLATVDFTTTGGSESFILRILGGATAANYSLNFSVDREVGVTLSNNVLFIIGSGSDDDFNVSFANASTIELIINGVTSSYPRAGIVQVYIDGGGGIDTAVVIGNAAAETIVRNATVHQLIGSGYLLNGLNLEAVTFQADAGDIAYLYDNPGSDLFEGGIEFSSLRSETSSVVVIGAGRVYTVSQGGGDEARFQGSSAGGETFYGLTTTSILISGNRIVQSLSYPTNIATSGGGRDAAVFVDSPADDLLTAAPNLSTLIGGGTTNQAINFTELYVFATTGNDTALLYDSPTTNDIFYGLPIYAILHGPLVGNQVEFFLEAISFDTMRGFSSGGTDYAIFYDSAGNDTVTVTSDRTQMSAGGAIVSTDQFAGNTLLSIFGGSDSITFDDGPGHDPFFAEGSQASLFYDGVRFTLADGFDQVTANAFNGGTNYRSRRAVDYALTFNGQWIDLV